MELQLNKRAERTLEQLLSGDEKLDRGDAVQLLSALGFVLTSRGSHHMWSHPKGLTKFTWVLRKVTEPVWGYQITSMRKAVRELLDSKKVIPMYKEIEKTQPATGTIIRIPKAPSPEKRAEIILNYEEMPDDICELFWDYQKRNISGAELADLLNESGYITIRNKPLTSVYVSNIALNNRKYLRWCADQEEQEKQMPEEQPKSSGGVDFVNFMKSMNEMILNNEKLERENAAMKAKTRSTVKLIENAAIQFTSAITNALKELDDE